MSIPGFVLLQGVVVGLNYGLLALGLVLVYRTNRVLNFAQGQLGVVAAVFLVKCSDDFGFNYWFSLVLAVVLAAAMGALSEVAPAPAVQPPPGAGHGGHHRSVPGALRLHRPARSSGPRTSRSPSRCPSTCPSPSATFIFSPGEVLTLIVAPVVALALAAFIRFSPWGLAMRAMSENIDSARLSGVWVRRTSTLAWTLAGVLSAFTAILASPGQTSVLTQPLSPDLLLFALTAALIGAMVNLTVAFVAGIGVGVIYEVLVVEHLVHGGRRRPSCSACCWPSCWSGWRRCARGPGPRNGRPGCRVGRPSGGSIDPLRNRVGAAGITTTVLVVVLLPFVLSVGQVVPALPDLHLRRGGAVADRPHRLGRTGVAGPVRPGGRGRGHGRPPRGQRAPDPAPALRRRGDRGRRRAGGTAGAAGPRPVPGRRPPWASPCGCRCRCWPRRAGRCP